MLKTIEMHDLPPAVKEWLKTLPSGADIVLTNDHQPVARLVSVTPRTPGLHAGQVWVSDDFDEPLPESFWVAGE